MFAGKHSLVQDSADEYSAAGRSVEDDVLLMLDTAISWLNLIAGAADLRRLGEPVEKAFQAVEIALSLLFTPGIHGVIGDINQIKSSQLRKLVGRQ